MTVEDVMTRDVISVAPEAPLPEVAALLIEHGISGVLVRDEAGELLGVVSEADILVAQGGPGDRAGLFGWLFDEWTAGELAKLRATTAVDAMSAPVRTIAPDRPLDEAARRMLDGNLKRLAVVADGELEGIVTRADLVRAFARGVVNRPTTAA